MITPDGVNKTYILENGISYMITPDGLNKTNILKDEISYMIDTRWSK